ncbi:glutathione peroxidase-like thioredoxin peroxidase [Plasmodium gonderi]|uniref:Glutathione peroxidase n=1 Tax=Plasmodium gonderi TaxID=77519 RepID=A0A1Y1JQU9_PLAGO|nr:glutathione peroxidase-like thioredoxin peroxidase [Plasmodium gonderi]GAW82853.1 glutathione peroxidase-like thioredoxin peroxidase [Plasmodium gonderi]
MKLWLFLKLIVVLLILRKNTVSMFSFFYKKITVSKSELLPSIYDYHVKKLDNTTIPMSNYKNKVLLIVNSASKCGLTKNHIKQFNELHDRMNARGLEILAFPTSQFLNQEFSNTCDISTFNEKNQIKYTVFAPIEVNGENTHELFKFLKANCDNMHDKHGTLENIGWNFGKFLVDKKGNVISYYSPRTNPLDIEKYINELL